MKRFLIVLLMAFSFPAVAGISYNEVGGAGWSNLTEEQKAFILQQTASMAAKNKGITSSVNPDKVEQWVGVGERIGKMIGGAAKEVGVAVNDFVKTPVGKMAMVIIVWHYMGNVLVHVAAGLLVLIVGLSFILYMLRRVRNTTYHYSPDKTDLFGRARLVTIIRAPLSDEYAFGYTVSAAVVVGASLLTMFSF